MRDQRVSSGRTAEGLPRTPVGILVPFQTMSLPGQFAYLAQQDPEHAYLRWPATAVTVFWVLCIQVVIVCTWRLLTLVKNDASSVKPLWCGWMRSSGRSLR